MGDDGQRGALFEAVEVAGKLGVVTSYPPQRWERPLDVAPGHWKKQLPGKYLQAAGRGDLVAVASVLEEHPDWIDRRGNHGRTLLWEAVRGGRAEVATLLLELGANPNLTGCYNGESEVQLSPYCAAVFYGRTKIEALLRPRVAQPDVFRAAFLGDQEAVQRHLQNDPGLLNEEDPGDEIYYHPPIAFAVAGEQVEVVRLLLELGVVVAPYSAMLLHIAALRARVDLASLLVDGGAVVEAVDGGIFVVANLDFTTWLLERGASATKAGKNGVSPLLYITRGDKPAAPEKVALLLQHGAAVDETGPRGTALHQAAAAGHARVLEVLLRHGASVTALDPHGTTPLE